MRHRDDSPGWRGWSPPPREYGRPPRSGHAASPTSLCLPPMDGSSPTADCLCSSAVRSRTPPPPIADRRSPGCRRAGTTQSLSPAPRSSVPHFSNIRRRCGRADSRNGRRRTAPTAPVRFSCRATPPIPGLYRLLSSVIPHSNCPRASFTHL
ncbi:hypothetical protein SDC9_201789 [bioreactor metagenome]|uniref:Uncharacterized protein n=1 Tax=bioreactor metagenome TaxID=1076179 RepID=A0A645ITA0_9ZZZZ